jgi:hypothetical protein
MMRNISKPGACCLPNLAGITYLHVGPQGHTVGMRGLNEVFQQLCAMERRPEEANDSELVGMARKFNYIPEKNAIEVEYAKALRFAYTAYHSQQGQKT